jgi:hypothetical protein
MTTSASSAAISFCLAPVRAISSSGKSTLLFPRRGLLIATPVFVFPNTLIAGLLAMGFDAAVLFAAKRWSVA